VILSDRAFRLSPRLANAHADPSADINNSRKIHAVWHRGKQAAGPTATFAP